MEILNKRDIALSVVIGAIGAVLFLFLFPGNAISTIMHQVLMLPGPGIGFGIVIGPFIIMCALIAYGLGKKQGIPLITSAAAGVFISVLIFVFQIKVAHPGTIGSAAFTAGAVVIGVVLEVMVYLLREKGELLKYAVSAVASDLIFLAYSMIAIFSNVMPDKYAQLTLDKIFIIFGASVIGAVIIGSLLSLLILRLTEFVKKPAKI